MGLFEKCSCDRKYNRTESYLLQFVNFTFLYKLKTLIIPVKLEVLAVHATSRCNGPNIDAFSARTMQSNHKCRRCEGGGGIN